MLKNLPASEVRVVCCQLCDLTVLSGNSYFKMMPAIRSPLLSKLILEGLLHV